MLVRQSSSVLFIRRMETAYRAELVTACPEAEEDRVFEDALAHACAFWLPEDASPPAGKRSRRGPPMGNFNGVPARPWAIGRLCHDGRRIQAVARTPSYGGQTTEEAGGGVAGDRSDANISVVQRARVVTKRGNTLKVFELHPEEGLDALQLVDRARPGIAAGSVRVRVRAVSLNYRDLMVARGSKKRARRIVPVSDGAGDVIEVGSGVQRLAIGDRVAAAFFPTWVDGPFAEEHHGSALGGSVDGMLAEEVVLPERAWVKIPSSYSFEQASTLPCAG